MQNAPYPQHNLTHAKQCTVQPCERPHANMPVVLGMLRTLLSSRAAPSRTRRRLQHLPSWPLLAPSSPSRGRAARRTLAAAARLGGPGARGAEAQVAAGERGERAQLGLRRRHLRGRAAAAHEAAQGAAARLLRPAARLSARACPSCVLIPTCSGRPCCAPSSNHVQCAVSTSYALTSGPPHPAHLASMRATETFGSVLERSAPCNCAHAAGGVPGCLSA